MKRNNKKMTILYYLVYVYWFACKLIIYFILRYLKYALLTRTNIKMKKMNIIIYGNFLKDIVNEEAEG